MNDPRVKRPSATRTEQWEWTAWLDGHKATASSELGAKYGVLCAAYDSMQEDRDLWKESEAKCCAANRELEAENERLREAVRLLQMWVAYASKGSIPPGVDIDKSTTLIERYLARHKEAGNG